MSASSQDGSFRTRIAGRNKVMPDVDPTTVVGAWVHSHEEDHSGTQVFRRSGYGFPRSRGRSSYELRPDGTLGGSGPGPDDRRVATTGSWDLQGRRLTITSAGGSHLQYEIQSVDPDRMVVKPVTYPQSVPKQ
jgi:YD repeat-containing protein